MKAITSYGLGPIACMNAHEFMGSRMVVGMVVWFSGDYVLDWTTPCVISLAAALIAYLVVALFETSGVVPIAAADKELSLMSALTGRYAHG